MNQDPKKPVKPSVPTDSRPAPKPVNAVKPAVGKPAPKPLPPKPVSSKPTPPKPASDMDGDTFVRQMAKPVIKTEETFLAEHTVEEGQTLSDIAVKYYKSSAREKWMKIYEANKTLIGNDPGKIKPGMVLKIPKID